MTETEKAALDAIVKLLREIDDAGQLAAEALVELETERGLIAEAAERMKVDLDGLGRQQAASSAAFAGVTAKVEALLKPAPPDDGEDGEDGGEPEPPSDVLFEWRDLTAPVELPTGAARDATYIYGVVKTDPPDGKYRKLFGADASEGRYAGLCVGINKNGQFEAWVDDGAGIRQVLLGLTPRKASFFAVRIASDALTAWVDDKVAAVTLPNGRKPCDGVAAAGKGVWDHAFKDPAFPGVTLPLLRVCRTLPGDLEVAGTRAELKDLVDPEPDGPPAPGPDPTPDPTPGPPPPDGLEPIDKAFTQATMDVLAGGQQTWLGFGHTASSPTAALKLPALVERYPGRLFEDSATRWIAFYGAHQNYRKYFELAHAHGVRGVFIHGFLYRQNITPAEYAAQIAALTWIPADTDIVICGQNESDGHLGNRWPGYPDINATWAGTAAATQAMAGAAANNADHDHDHDMFEPVPVPGYMRASAMLAAAQPRSVVLDTKALRAALDGRGLQRVKIVTNAYAHFGSMCDTEFDALVASGFTPDGIGGHGYSDCPTPENFTRARKTKLGGIFSTETGYGGAQNSPARLLAAINNGAVVHLQFEGQAADDGDEARKNCLVYLNGGLHPCYNPYRALNPPLLPGSVVRRVTCDNRPAGLSADYAKYMVRHRGPGGLIYPKVHGACTKRPDGKWFFGASSAAWGSTVVASTLAAHWGAEPFQVTVRVAELAGKDGVWTGQRCTAGSSIQPASARMVGGWLRFKLAAGETLALVGGAN